MRCQDANARASVTAVGVSSPAYGYVATVTSPLEVSGHIWPGLLEMTMNAYVAGPSGGVAVDSRSRIEAYLQTARFERPTLVLDTEAVTRNYAALAQGLGRARIH